MQKTNRGRICNYVPFRLNAYGCAMRTSGLGTSFLVKVAFEEGLKGSGRGGITEALWEAVPGTRGSKVEWAEMFGWLGVEE